MSDNLNYSNDQGCKRDTFFFDEHDGKVFRSVYELFIQIYTIRPICVVCWCYGFFLKELYV